MRCPTLTKTGLTPSRVRSTAPTTSPRSVRAVRAQRVFYTFGFWYWWDPAGVLAETLYLARLFHPEKFGRLDLEEEGNAIFEKFYHKEDVFSTLLKTLDFNDWTNP